MAQSSPRSSGCDFAENSEDMAREGFVFAIRHHLGVDNLEAGVALGRMAG